jgi:hypothetical protein
MIPIPTTSSPRFVLERGAWRSHSISEDDLNRTKKRAAKEGEDAKVGGSEEISSSLRDEDPRVYVP